MSRVEAKVQIEKFLDNQMPYLMGFVNQYDDIYLSKLFNNQEKPYHYMPLDLATLLYFQGIDPDSDFSTQFGVDSSKYREHHALDDARWTRDVYLKMLE